MREPIVCPAWLPTFGTSFPICLYSDPAKPFEEGITDRYAAPISTAICAPASCPTRAQQRPVTVLSRALLPPQPFTVLIHTHSRSLAVGGFLFIPYAGSRNLFRTILALLPILGLEPISNRQMIRHHCEQLVCGVPIRIITQKGAIQGGTLNVLAVIHVQGHLVGVFTARVHVG